MKIGLIGAGRQGKRRTEALRQSGDSLVIVADINQAAAESLAQNFGCKATTQWEEIVEQKEIEAVLICTPPDSHASISIAAMSWGKHVFCEKPLARNPEEAKQMMEVAQRTGMKLKCGFNLRFHPGIRQARKWFDEGVMGELNFIRCRYGIMARPDYTTDWRAKVEIAGGGEMLDRGVHVIDFFRWFMGDFSEVVGFVTTRFWDFAPLEDNAFALFRTSKGQVASMHVSSTQWRNIFSLELFGHDGYIIVDGLGYVYGNERAILGKRQTVPGPNHEEVIEYLGPDQSWLEEWQEFVSATKENREPEGNGYDGWQTLRLAYAVYESNRKGCVVKLT
jgi:predicted dehydrogenase